MTHRKIVLFYPYIPQIAKQMAGETLDSRFIGQGPRVDEFEDLFERHISRKHKAIAVNSCTSALHLAFILAGIEDGCEVISPVFSCSATHIPLLYQRAKIVFADIQPSTLNIDPNHVRALMNERVKAIVCVHYGGLPCDMEELQSIARQWNVPIIEDAAQAIGATYKGRNIGEISEFTAFSFQAVKLLTTIDGGMLTVNDLSHAEKAKRLRWFGIDRKAKFENRWNDDIFEVGYKYQMTDVEASLGIGALNELANTMTHYRDLFEHYKKRLARIPGITFIGEKSDRRSACWLATIFADRRADLKRRLAEHDIEADPAHYRCDKHTIFGGRVKNCPNMDTMEDKYLLLPMHYHLNLEDIDRICDVLSAGW